MNAPAVLAVPSWSTVGRREDDEMSLAAMLELFEPEDPATLVPAAPVPVGLLATTQNWVQRAAEWGAGPGGAWRAW